MQKLFNDDLHLVVDPITGIAEDRQLTDSLAGKDLLTGGTAVSLQTVKEPLQTAENLLAGFATAPDFGAKIKMAFGNSFNVASADVLAKAWGAGDFSTFPKIEIRNSAEINCAKGAFAAANNTIYLSREFLSENAANNEAVVSVLLEEFGHALDTQLNDADTPGDEGEIFSALVQGEKIEAEQLERMKAEDDTATITLDGQFVQIEQANINLNQTINESLTNTDPNNPTRSGRFTDEYTLSGVSDWQQIQVNLNSSEFDGFLQLVNASTGELIASDDDSGGRPNAQISFTKYPGIDYLIRATSFDSGATGNYTLNTSSLGIGSSLIATLNGRVGTVDSLGRFTQIATGSEFYDIALSNNGQLFGINSSQLYRVNPGSGSSSLIGNFGINESLNALEFASNNVLYGAGGSSLYTIDVNTGVASLVANLGSEFSSSGDLVFDAVNNRFLATSTGTTSDSLYSVTLAGQATKIGDIGFNNVFGLSFENGTLFGFTSNGLRITINPTTGAGTINKEVKGFSGQIGGAASIVAVSTDIPQNPDTLPSPLITTGGNDDDFLIGGGEAGSFAIIDGVGGNDTIYGDDSNDSLVGGDGNDILQGIAIGDFPGLELGGIDSMFGGAGQDIFVLGVESWPEAFYDDGDNLGQGTSHYVIIEDLNPNEDKIQLKGIPADYILGSSPISGVSGTGVYLDKPGNEPDELIGIILGVLPSSLNLNSNYFLFPIQANQTFLEFSALEFRVGEDGTPITEVTVIRSGGTDGSVSATVNLSNGSAIAPDDYGNTAITVNFAPGETQKTITVPIINDTSDENDETIALTLANPTGGAAIGQQNSATLVIVDNDDSVAAPGEEVDLGSLRLKVVGGNFTRNNTTNRFETSSNVQIGLKPKEGENFKPLIAVQQGKVEYDDKTLNVDGTVFSSIGNVAAPLFKGKFDVEVGKVVTKSFEETEKLPNDFKLAGLDIDFKSLAFNQDGIGLGGRFKLPDNIGGILVDSLSPSPDTVFIRENGVSFGANEKRSLPNFKDFSLLGILPINELSDASLEYIAPEEKIKIQGKLSLNPFLKQENDSNVKKPENNLKPPEVVIDLSGDNFIEVKDGKADIKGSLSVNNITLGKVWGLNVKLALDTINKDIGGDAKVTYAFGKGVPTSENTGIGLGLGFKLPIPPVELNRITGELDLANFPIFNTGVYLQEVGVELNNIAPSDPDPFDFTLNGRFTAGPEVTLPLLNETFSLFDANLSGTASFEKATQKFEQLKLTGKFKLIRENIGDFGGDLTLNVNKNFGEFNLNGSFFKDVIKSQLGFKVNTPKFDIKATGNASINIPQSIPLFGGTQIGSGRLLLDFSNDGNTSNDFAAGWGTLDIKKLGVDLSIVMGVKGYFDGRFERIGAKNIPETNSFIVDPGTKYIVLGADWENAANNVPVQVKAPNGTIYNESDFAATGKIAIVDELTDSNTKAVIVLNPEPGVWDINVANPTNLGKVQYSAIRDSVSPTIEVTAPATDITDQNVTINYNAFDADSNAKVSLFYDTDNQGFDGILIVDNLAETDGGGSFVWNTEGVATGDYYVYAMVMDENNAPVSSYSPGRVKITESADLSVVKAVNENPDVSGNFTYTLTVTNNGPNDAKGATLTDTLPEGVTLVAASLNPNQQSGNDITFDLGDLANGASKTVNVTITPPPNGTITGIPGVTSRTFDPDVSNDFALASSTVSDTSTNVIPEIGTTNRLVFDDKTYLSLYPDVRDAYNNGGFEKVFDHFTTHGILENRDLRVRLFDETYYLDRNSDVKQAVDAGEYDRAFDHFILWGLNEGRKGSSSDNSSFRLLFDENYYLGQNPDVKAAVDTGDLYSGLIHYFDFGQFEGRKISVSENYLIPV